MSINRGSQEGVVWIEYDLVFKRNMVLTHAISNMDESQGLVAKKPVTNQQTSTFPFYDVSNVFKLMETES